MKNNHCQALKLWHQGSVKKHKLSSSNSSDKIRPLLKDIYKEKWKHWAIEYVRTFKWVSVEWQVNNIFDNLF